MSNNEFKLISAGIDIGTTTTQLIISELTLKNRLPGARIPKIEIVDKKILYKSQIYITPIIDHELVDAGQIRKIIDYEYGRAGFRLEQIDTGAIIITGESAKKENAEKIIHELAEYAGDFVVAAAGPELESILSGKGAGACEYSKQNLKTVINLDIGGGTTNISVFENGNVVDAVCINVGGRLVEVDPQSETAAYISKPAKIFIDNYGIDIKVGNKIDLLELEELCRRMVEFVDNISEGISPDAVLSEILMTAPLKRKYDYQGLMFSGGVSEYIYNEDKYETEKFKYGDIGYFLGRAFKNSRLIKKYRLLVPDQTIRATVVGAGTQTVSVSGSTIFIKPELLPLRNVPAAKLDWDSFPDDYLKISSDIVDITKRYESDTDLNALALCIPCPEELTFENIKKTAMGIYNAWVEVMNKKSPLIILLEKDIGKVLGQTLFTLSKGTMNFVSLDSISINDGDYIDVGKPIEGDKVVPVIIKTLVFSTSGH